MKDGALIAYERNGGPRCIDELFAIYPDGRMVGDNGTDRSRRRSPPPKWTLAQGDHRQGLVHR